MKNINSRYIKLKSCIYLLRYFKIKKKVLFKSQKYQQSLKYKRFHAQQIEFLSGLKIYLLPFENK